MRLNGLRYHVEIAGSGPPLLLLHGFTGDIETWRDALPALAERHTVIAVDLPGHGRTESPVDPHRYRIEHVIADLLTLLDGLGIERTDVLGYSMGGRIALHLAVAASERVGRLFLESASPGIEGPVERAARVRTDEALADRIEREGIESFVSYWEQIPLFASQRRLAVDVRNRVREQRLGSDPIGLAGSLRGFGAGVPEPLWDRLQDLPKTLLIVGELDEKYAAIAERMQDLIPRAEVAVIPEAGHTVHLEQPEQFVEAIVSYEQCAVS